jgi:2-haloacid dehalogenase
MTTPRAVIFDIGNVLLEWNPEGFYDRQIGPDARRRLFAEVDLTGMNLSVDAGAPFRATVMATAAAHPAWSEQIRWWHDRWGEMATPLIDRSVRLLRALRARGVPVFALSNFGDDSFAHAQRMLPVLTEFDRTYVSGRMGVTKPDPAIYAAVEADCGLPPEALLFTDDKADNIAAATRRGWQTHHFTDPAGLADRLVGAGLLSRTEAA